MATAITLSPSRDIPAIHESLERTAESNPASKVDRPHLLTVSPYTAEAHLLNLSTLDLQSQLFALALQILTPTDNKYATTEYSAAFKWTHVMDQLSSLVQATNTTWHQQEFYVVEFRSRLKKEIDRDLLFALDRESHREATQSGGLLKYWFGVPDENHRNLATCLWRSKEDAIKGGRGPWHRQARNVISKMYDQIDVKGLRLTIEDDVKSWTFVPYIG